MTHKDLFKLLKTVGIPVAYDHFEDNKNLTPPFMAYREQSPNNFKADGITYYSALNFEIELVAFDGNLHIFITTNPAPINKNKNDI